MDDGIEHSQTCIQSSAVSRAALDAYEANWPDYCRWCGAGGTITYTENGAPHGEGYWPMIETDWCEHCCAGTEPVCPRCAAPVPVDAETEAWPVDVNGDPASCPACGWAWGANEGDSAPALTECYCWETQLPADFY